MVIIYHNNAQLEKPITQGGYGREGAKNILSNVACKIYFSQDLNEDAEALSKSLGYKTVKKKNQNQNSGRGLLDHGTTGRQISDEKRALMLPQEIREMKFDKSLILITGENPIQAKKPLYFTEKVFIDKLRIVSPSLREVKGIPTETQFKQAFQNGETSISIQGD